MKTWDTFDYRIAGHWLSALINGETSGLNDDEEKQFSEWEKKAKQNARDQGFTVGHWCDVDGSGEEWGRCDITGLFAMRCTVQLHVYRESIPC